jgi:hypothetical protein
MKDEDCGGQALEKRAFLLLFFDFWRFFIFLIKIPCREQQGWPTPFFCLNNHI